MEEKQENCTGTLDSICTEGSLEEPRYAKVISTLTHIALTHHFKHFGHFSNSGDSQTEERFKLNAKAGKKKTRGTSDNKVSFLATLVALHITPVSKSVGHSFELA